MSLKLGNEKQNKTKIKKEVVARAKVPVSSPLGLYTRAAQLRLAQPGADRSYPRVSRTPLVTRASSRSLIGGLHSLSAFTVTIAWGPGVSPPSPPWSLQQQPALVTADRDSYPPSPLCSAALAFINEQPDRTTFMSNSEIAPVS